MARVKCKKSGGAPKGAKKVCGGRGRRLRCACYTTKGR
jgi:hypothetical protein